MSRVFKPYELREIERRQFGDFSDRNGTFSKNVKPKILELLQEWFPRRAELQRMVKPKR